MQKCGAGEGGGKDEHEGVVGGAKSAEKGDDGESARRAFALPGERRGERRHQAERAERVDPLDVGLAPEAGCDGEEAGAECRRRPSEPEAAGKDEENRHRRRRAGGGEEAHAEGDRADRQHYRPQFTQEDVERVGAGMWNAQEVNGGGELTAVADVDRAAGAGGVDGEPETADRGADPALAGCLRAGLLRCPQGVFCSCFRFCAKSALSGSRTRQRSSARMARGRSPAR